MGQKFKYTYREGQRMLFRFRLVYFLKHSLFDKNLANVAGGIILISS